MTEAEWSTCTDVRKMLAFLKGKVSDRKLRLFAVACCRAIWPALTYQRSRVAVEVAELFADDLASEAALHKAHSDAFNAVFDLSFGKIGRKLTNSDGRATQAEGRLAFAGQTAHLHKPFLLGRLGWLTQDEQLKRSSPAILREVFGPGPLRAQPSPDRWLSATVRDVASAIYADRAFDHLPILADALEDAGCTDAAILDHCRQPGEHVRGCWVVDLVLGKS